MNFFWPDGESAKLIFRALTHNALFYKIKANFSTLM